MSSIYQGITFVVKQSYVDPSSLAGWQSVVSPQRANQNESLSKKKKVGDCDTRSSLVRRAAPQHGLQKHDI